jgi:hypothetical protein
LWYRSPVTFACPAEHAAAAAYTPPKYVPPPRVDRWKRNLIVWILCAIVIYVAVAAFVNFYLA